MTDSKVLDKAFHIIMKQMVNTGIAPHYTDMAKEMGITPAEGRKILHDLFAAGIPGWLHPDTDFIVSFAPFNNLPTQFKVTIDGDQKWFAQ